jgi:hypothetical protein
MHGWKRFFNPIPGNLEQSNYRIFEPNNQDGKAEIFHWFSRDDIPKVTKDEFIEALINFETGFDNKYEDFYRYRAYFLAAEALSYFPDSRFGDEIVNQLLKWSYVYFGWQIIPSPLKQAARQTLKITDRNRVITAFTQLLHSTTSRVTLRHAAVELGKFDPGNKTAIAALILLLDVTQDDYLRSLICKGLGEIGNSDENAILAIASVLGNSQNKKAENQENNTSDLQVLPENSAQAENDCGLMQHSALELLAVFSTNPLDKERLRMILGILFDFYSFGEIVTSIGKYSSTNETTIGFLLTLLEITQSGFYFPNKGEELIPEIAEVLTTFDNYFELGINILIEIIETTDDKYQCERAIVSLGRVDFKSANLASKKHSEIVALLEHFLQVNWGDRICWRGAESLLKIDPNNETAFSALLNILEFNREYGICFCATEVLLKSSVNHKKVLKILLELTHTSDDDSYQLLNHSVEKIGEFHLHKESCTDFLISGFIRLIQCYEENRNTKDIHACIYLNYDENLLTLSRDLQEIITPEYFPNVIKSLKQYLDDKSYKNTSYRYEAAYNLIWYCAQNMNYLDFYNTLTTQHC